MLQFRQKLDIVHRIMRFLSLTLLLSAFTQNTFAQSSNTPTINDLLPLRSCAYSVSNLIEGIRIYADWASDDENSNYFLNCDDDYDKGQDHYVFTPNGVYYFFIKYHKDYKGGFEGTQFRLSLENKTYYFKSNIAGGMGQLFDHSGKNLSIRDSESENARIDVSAKNPVINYYMKTLTGKSDAKSAIIATPATGERLLKAQACIQNQITELSTSLVKVYRHRLDYQQVSLETLVEYEAFAEKALSHPSCASDPKISELMNKLILELRE